MNHDDRRLVYSTDGGWVSAQARRRPQTGKENAPPDDGVIRVAHERRRASEITVVTGVAAAQIEEVGKALRRLCGAGGTTKDGRIEIQGEHRDRIVAFFEARGARVKRAGG